MNIKLIAQFIVDFIGLVCLMLAIYGGSVILWAIS